MRILASRYGRLVVLALALVAATLVHGRANATVGAYVTMPTLVRLSEVIVTGTVLGQQSSYDAARRHVYTRTVVHVSHYYKGEGPSEIVVETVGGRVGHMEAVSIGMPTFTAGEDVMLFLHPGPGYFWPAAMSQGVFHLQSTHAGPTATRDLRGMAFVGPGADAASHETSVRVEDLEALVTQLVGAAR